ncbi:MAG: anthranilate synthase component I family protein [Polyangiales bacterium]
MFSRGGETVLGHVGSVLVCEHDRARALDAFALECEARRDRLRFGWLSYDALRSDEPGSARDGRPRGDLAPIAFVAEITDWIAFADGAVRGASSDALERALCADGGPSLELIEPLSLESATGEGEHRAQLAVVREAILDGEVYLVNVARVLHTRGPLSDGQIAARVARSRAPFAAMARGGGCTIGAMSMERALRWDRASRLLETRPIKGTRPRDADPARDRELAEELAASEKERAENVMAVDVHRNDLGRIAEVGSVSVESLCAVEPHPFVHHLVSTVRARAREGASVKDVLEAMLPVGSVTGAPKRSAMQWIARIEAEQRGLYTGAYGVIERDGSLDLAVAIRTIVADARRANYGSGGGIVIDSDPAHEWAELAWKERALAGRPPR